MKCVYCGEEMDPVDLVESPIYGGLVATDYECPNNCEFVKWIEENGGNDNG